MDRIDLLHEIKCVVGQVVGPFERGTGNSGFHKMWEMWLGKKPLASRTVLLLHGVRFCYCGHVELLWGMLLPNGNMMKHVCCLYCTIVPLAETLETNTSHSIACADIRVLGGTLVWVGCVCLVSFRAARSSAFVIFRIHLPVNLVKVFVK